MEANKLLYDLPKGLWNWYPFRENSRVLYIGNADDPLAEFLSDAGLKTVCVEYKELLCTDGREPSPSFDYIAGIRLLEQCSRRKELLRLCRTLLKEDGVLLLGEENRYGLRYFCGEREPHTGRSFDGIENYRTEGLKSGANGGQNDERLFAHFEMEELLHASGFCRCKFYSILSALEFPQMIYAQDYLPEEEMTLRYTPYYNQPETLFLEETYLYDDLIKNGMFHQMANAYLVECPLNGSFSDICHVTISMDRGRERALTTSITSNGQVIKRAVYAQGKQCLTALAEHMQDLQRHGIKIIPGALQKDGYVMPYMKAENGVQYFRRLFFENREKFVEQIDKFQQCIMQSSEEVTADKVDFSSLKIPGVSSAEEINLGKYYKHVYLDMIPLNCFVQDDEFFFFDQEFCMENYPINVVLYRMLYIIYQGDVRIQEILPVSYFMEKYGLEEKKNVYSILDGRFTAMLRNKSQLAEYNQKHREKGELLYLNRQRINYPQEKYQKLFVDIFDDTQNRKIYLFGSGNYAVRFMEWFEDGVYVDAILDNNRARWGQRLNKTEICSPECLRDLEPESYKVIICVRKYLPVMRQLQQAGAKYISVYNAYIDYPRNISKLYATEQNRDWCRTPKLQKAALKNNKKYHVGYVAGVFDLFHIGHLNIFKRAKEYCDYLIVGVVTDEGVQRNKNRKTYIPFEERIELVRSCKYVDEAVKIPLNSAGTRDAFRRYHFDCQFSGSDYANDPFWLQEQAYLRSQGAELIFFPYTKQTSSTMIRKAICVDTGECDRDKILD